MVAIVSGSSLGLGLSSLGTLGLAGTFGNATLGRTGEQAYVNVATGNLVVQRRDDVVMGHGENSQSLRTYNSQGLLNDDNGDNWLLNGSLLQLELNGTANTAGSTVVRTDRDGARATYTWDAVGSRYVSTSGGGAYDQITYDATAGRYEWTDGDTGLKASYSAAGRLLSSYDARGNTLTYGYNAGGRLSTVASSSGQTTCYDYTGNNLSRIRQVMADGSELSRIQYGYDGSNRLVSVKVDLTPADRSTADGAYHETTYSYDGSSTRITAVNERIGAQDAVALMRLTYVQVGSDWKVATATDAMGATTGFSYDVAGRRTTVTDALGRATVYGYDAAGQLTLVTPPAVSGGSSTSYSYDGNGNLVKTVDGSGRRVEMEYDARGNQTLQRDGDGNTVTRTWTARNQLLTETVYLTPDPDGAGALLPGTPLVTRYVYQTDKPDLLRFLISPDGRVTEYGYNGYGEQTSSRRYEAATYAIGASAPSEATMVSWAAAQNASAIELTTMEYDFRGQLTRLNRYGATTTAGAGDTTTLSQTQFVYDAQGRLLKTVAPGNAVTAYTYDGLDRVLSVSDPLSQLTTTTYDDGRGRISVRQSNGVTTTSAYDRAGRLVSTGSTSPTGGALGTTTYTYDALGRLLMTRDPAGQRSWSIYDDAGRKVADVDANGSLTEYGYDGAGRMVYSRAYATAVDTALLVDANGNALPVSLASVRPKASASDPQRWSVYDGAGRLARTVDPHGAVTESVYDGAGRLTRTVQYASTISISGLGSAPAPSAIAPVATPGEDRVTRHFYNGDGQRLATLDAEGYLTEQAYDAAGRDTVATRYATRSPASAWATGSLSSLRPAASSADQRTVSYHDDQGRLTGVVDAEGYLTETVYNARGTVASTTRYATRLTATADPAAALASIRPVAGAEDRKTSFVYDALDRKTQETNPEGTVIRFTYDSAGRVTSVVRAAGTSEQTTALTRYDWLGRVVSELSPLGAAQLTATMTTAEVDAVWARYGVDYAYDVAGRRISATDANGYKTLYFYDADGHLTHTVNPLGEVEERQYNALGRLTATLRYATRISRSGLVGGVITSTLTDALAAIADEKIDARTSYSWRVGGALSTVKDALGYATTRSYNAFGDLVSTTQALGSGKGRVDTQDVDRRGLVTTTVSDATSLALAATTVYDAFGRAVSVTDAGGSVTRSSYDRLGRVVQTTDPSGATRKSSYDAFDRVLTQTDALGRTTRYAYDKTTRSLVVTTPDGVSVKTVSTRGGQVLSLTDGRGNVTTFSYDDDGNAIAKTAGGITTTSTYDAAHRLLETTDGNGTVTRYQYDAANRVLTQTVDPADKVTNPEGLSLATRYEYDALGRKVLVKPPTGYGIDYEYDRDGRMLTETVYVKNTEDPDAALIPLETIYTYDGADRVLTVTDPEGTLTRYTYDALGRRTDEVVDPGKLKLARHYEYDETGNVVEATDPMGATTRYAYDANDRLILTGNALGQVTRQVYDAEGRLTSVIRYADTVSGEEQLSAVVAGAGDQITRYRYDPSGRLAYTVDALGAVTHLEYDENGNVVQRTEHARRIGATDDPADVAASSADRVSRYVYDALNRETWRSDPTGAVTRTAYDANGNVTAQRQYAQRVPGASPDTAERSAGDRVVRMTYDAANRLRYRADALGYVTGTTYDRAGRVLSTTRYATPVGSKTLPSDVVASDADRKETCSYDAAGRLTDKTDALGNSESWQYDLAGRKTEYTNQKGDVWTYEYDDAGRLTSETAPEVELTSVSVNETTGALVLGSTRSAKLKTTYEYDAAGRLKARIEAAGRAEARKTSYAYDNLGRQTSVTYPSADPADPGATTSSKTYYDTFGNAVSSVDAFGAKRFKAYDAAGRVAYEVDPLGYVTSYARNAFGEATSVTRYAVATALASTAAVDADTDVTIATVSAAVQADGVDHSQDRKLSTAYDAAGRVVKVTESATHTYDSSASVPENGYDTAAGKTTVNTYNAFGDLVMTSQLLNRRDDTWVHRWHYFDLNGRETATADELGYLTRKTYDGAGNLLSVSESAAKMAAGSWDVDGYSAPSASDNDRLTAYAYDALNRKVSETRVDVEYSTSANGTSTRGDLTTRYAYDAVGNLTRTIDAAGGRTYSYYDALGRVLAVTAPSRSSTTDGESLTPVIEFRRDAYGNVVAKIERANTAEGVSLQGYTVDASSRDRVTKTRYDLAGHAVQVDDAAGYQHFSSYTDAGRLYKSWQIVTDNDDVDRTLYTTYSYDLLGRVIKTTAPGPSDGTASRTTTEYVYNGFGELVSKGINGLAQERYEYDKGGHLWRTNSQGGNPKVFLYDLLGRATAEIGNAGSGRSNPSDLADAANAAEAAGYTSVRRVDNQYDALGRLVAKLDAERQIEQGGVTIRAAKITAGISSSVSSEWVETNAQSGNQERRSSGTNVVKLDWTTLAYLGSGEVRVDLTYMTLETRRLDSSGKPLEWLVGGSPPVQRTESQIFRGDTANSGVALTWTSSRQDRIDGTEGVASIVGVVVYKKNVNGDWVRVFDRNPGKGRPFGVDGNFIEAGSPLDPTTALTFEYRLRGKTDWIPVGTSRFGDSHWWDASSLTAGTYEYQVKLTPNDGRAEVVESGSWTAGVVLDDADTEDKAWLRPTEKFSFDRWGNMTSRSDPRVGKWRTVYLYNAANQLIEERQPNPEDGDQDANSPIRNVFYDRLGRQIAVRDARGYVNGTSYDAAGNLVTESHADGGRVTHAYNAFGDRVRTIDAVGNDADPSDLTRQQHTTVFAYDKLGRLTSTTHGTADDGSAAVYDVGADMTLSKVGWRNLTERFTYDAAGRKLSQTNGAGETTRYWYDAAGHIVKTEQPLEQTSSARYDAYGHKVSETDGNGKTMTWKYDYFGRLTDHNDLSGENFDYAYDNAGQLVAQTSGHGQDLRFAYDAAGQLVQIKDDTLHKVTTYAYDLTGHHLREKVAQYDSSTKSYEVLQDNHLGYDALGRLRSSADNRSLLTFAYDAVGNRTRVTTRVRVDAVGDNDVETLKKEDRYFDYDGMNRQVLVDADADGNIGERGHILAYDLNGNRIRDTFFGNRVIVNGGKQIVTGYDDESGAALYATTRFTYSTTQGTVTERYRYDALGRLQSTSRDGGMQVDLRYYDGASRLVQSGPKDLKDGYAEALNAGLASEDAIGLEIRRYRYDDNGRLAFQRTWSAEGQSRLNDIDYEGKGQDGQTLGYDDAGNVVGYEFRNFDGDHYVNTTVVQHALYDGYLEAKRSTTSTLFQDGSSTSAYDANGYLVRIDDATENSLDRRIANDASGRALRVTQAGNTLYSLIVNGELLGRHGVAPDAVDPRTDRGAARFAQVAEFDFGYRSITGSYPQASVGQYTVHAGDTLASIARSAYGDSRQWWRIAQANGLSGDTDLRVGQSLTLPSLVSGAANSDTTFQPYDPSAIVGDTSPNLPMPKADDGCGTLGMIVMVVVAVAVTVYTAGAAAEALSVTMAQLSAGSVAVGAGAAAVGSIASQAVGMAIGAQDSFDWKQVALSAVAGGVSAGIAGAVQGGSQLLQNVVVRGAISNAMSQGIGVVTGLQDHFDWTAVAASAAGAGMGSLAGNLSGQIGASLDLGEASQKLFTGTAAGLVAGMTTAAFRGGRVSVQQIAADAFGNALASSLAEASRPETQGVGPYSAADYRNGSDIESDNYTTARQAEQQMLANNRTALNAANVAADADYYSGPTPEQSQAMFRQSERDYRQATDTGAASMAYRADDRGPFGAALRATRGDRRAALAMMATWREQGAYGVNANGVPQLQDGQLLPWVDASTMSADQVTAYARSGGQMLGAESATRAALANPSWSKFAPDSIPAGYGGGMCVRPQYGSQEWLASASPEELKAYASYANAPSMTAYDPAAAQARERSLAQTSRTLAYAVGGPVMTGWAAGAELAGAPPEVVDNLMQAQTGLAMAMVGGRRSTLEPVDVFPRNGVGVSTSYAFNALENPGPLASLRGNPAGNFYGGRYDASVLSEDLVLYRAGEGAPGKELGQWFTRVPPKSVAEVRIDSAVKPQWIDPETGAQQGTSPIDTVYAVRIPKGSTIYEGPVGSQGGVYVGGPLTNQIYVHRPWDIPGVKVLDSTPLR